MKKFLTLVLALVLALGLTVPAMAFTSDDSAADESIPYDLSIYLVEYDDNDLFGIIALPESDRGYAKNEIVAAVVELEVPDGEDVAGDGYTTLEITGDNVNFNVTDQPINNTAAAALVLQSDGSDGWHVATAAMGDDVTYKWLVFAKITDDDASVTAKLLDGTAAADFTAGGHLDLTLGGVDYDVDRPAVIPAADFAYTITVADTDSDYNNSIITINVDKNYKSIGMSLNDGTYSFPLGVNTSGELGLVKGAVIDTAGDDYDDLMDLYDDVVVDVFGMDYFLIGHYVRDSFFEGLVSVDTIIATVDIEPWTAYVSVPDNVVVDPPKTGDAASIMGFVMVALSGAGAVSLKKRG